MILPFLKKTKKVKAKNFLKLKSRDQKKILMEAVKKSNEKQYKLYKKYSYIFDYK